MSPHAALTHVAPEAMAPAARAQQQCAGGACADRARQDGIRPVASDRGWGAQPPAVPPVVGEVVRSAGQPLDAAARAFFAPRFGHDFGRVRVHADAQAAQSARAIDAVAYSVGDHIAVDPCHAVMRSPQAPLVLAHELAHVAQHPAEPAPRHPLRVDTPASAAERQATHAASRVARGETVTSSGTKAGSGVVHRALRDILAGGAIGAAAGGLIGSIFGPIGALIGTGVGLLGGLVAGEVLGAGRRGLTSDEKREATIVFGTSLDMSAVKIAESSVMSAGNYARTPFGTIYVPPGFFKRPFSETMPILIHELTHVWQYQHGISVTEKVWWALHGRSAYDYGDEAGLRAASAANKRFLDFNTEQQASIAEDFYRSQRAGLDTSAYQPFIAQLQAGGVVRGTTNAPAPPPAPAPSGGTP